ncbi:MAG: DEAD/DEAH box helicase family protein [Vulcanococcus sp.]
MSLQLRPYQSTAVAEIRAALARGHRSVLFVLPTGGGKTVVFSHIAEQAAAKGNRICILVHRVELLEQASTSLRGLGVRHGLIAANRSMDLSAPVQVASVATLARRLHRLPADLFQLLVVDEAHHSNAGTWAKVLAHFASARVLGVTATPVRGDGRGLGEWYGEMVLGPSPAWLTEQGYLAPARVFAPPGFSAEGLRRRMGDFDMGQAAEAMARPTITGGVLAHYRQHLDGRTAIAFCCSVAHAEAVARLFAEHGVPAASIDGTMDAATRRRLLEQLSTGALKVLTSCALIGEGVDVPSVGGCILLRPTQSEALHLQMIGRCLRPQDGKTAVILDHVGNCGRLGHHLDDRTWTLDGVRKRQREAAPSVRVCPACFAAASSRVSTCPECGHQFAPQRRELEHVEGQLAEIERSTAARERAREQGQARTLQDLIALGRRRQMRDPLSWARYVLAARQRKGQWRRVG